MRRVAGMVIAALLASAASAQDKLRDLCTDRPGLDTPACTVDQGHLQIELGLGDWTLDKQPDSRTDTVSTGQVSARYGIGASTELRVAWTAYTHVRTRDRASGAIDRVGGVGDVVVGIKQNLANPDGSGFSLAVLPQAMLPTGKDGIGAGDWGGGLLVPIDYALSDSLTLEMTPEIDAAVNEDGSGRHLAYGSAIGLQTKLGKKASMSAEFEAIRDRDPGGHGTTALAGVYLGYQPQDTLQLDLGGQAGLNRQSPDVEVYVGVSKKF